MDLYRKIKLQRETIEAPVDTIGCASAGRGLSGDQKKFHILVALLLSSQTKDEVTYGAVQQLRLKLGGLTPEKVDRAPAGLIHACILKVGYHNKKLKYLIEISRRLRDRQMPASLEETLALPGVGRKMAYLYLQHACDVNAGIGVDTHVLRISRRIGLSSASQPEGVRADLERAFDSSEWPEINRVLVGFGQTMCTAVAPRCTRCAVRHECPSSTAKSDKKA